MAPIDVPSYPRSPNKWRAAAFRRTRFSMLLFCNGGRGNFSPASKSGRFVRIVFRQKSSRRQTHPRSTTKSIPRILPRLGEPCSDTRTGKTRSRTYRARETETRRTPRPRAIAPAAGQPEYTNALQERPSMEGSQQKASQSRSDCGDAVRIGRPTATQRSRPARSPNRSAEVENSLYEPEFRFFFLPMDVKIDFSGCHIRRFSVVDR